MLMFDLIILCCMLPVLGMEYVVLRNQATCQKGLLLGVTLPEGEADSDPARAIAARFRRELKAAVLLCGALAVPPVLARTTWVALTLWMLWLCLAMALPFLPFIRANRALRDCKRARQELTAGAKVAADEDDAWIWGLFYYAPQDPRTMVAKRVGIGTTVNLATAGGKALTAFAAGALALCLFIGPVLGILDSRPTRLVISGQTLTALHGGSEKYALPLDGITDVQLRDALPEASRTFGTGLDHYCQGDFYVTGEGSALFCLDPTAPVFLRVEAEGQVYWFTAETEEQTRAMARWLQQRQPGG